MSGIFTDEIRIFIFEHNRGLHLAEITDLVNKTFGTSYIQMQLKAFRNRNHLISGFTGRYEKGNVPFNRGRKGFCAAGCEKTWFKKGHRPHNTAPVGAEAVTKDGYIKVKVAEPNVWKMKNVLVWEENKGPVPEGCIVIFRNGDKRDFRIENLELITMGENALLNHQHLRSENAEITDTAITLVKLQSRIWEKRNG